MVLDPGTFPHAHHAACFVAGFQYMNTLASYDYGTISGLNPFTCVWPTIPFPLAPQVQLPSPAQSSVLARWLAFGQAGLSSSLTSGFLGALIWIVFLFGIRVKPPARLSSQQSTGNHIPK